MSSKPRLTIGIPTQGKRPERLRKAIRCALNQSAKTAVIVADQDTTGTVAQICGEFSQWPTLRRIPSPAKCLWENWSFAAHQADTDYFAWLQDDDVIRSTFAARVELLFNLFPSAAMYLARLNLEHIGRFARWWEASGPVIPLDTLYLSPGEIGGNLVAAGGYFLSWALSPAVAFRLTPDALAAIGRCPIDADCFVERLVLAELATLGSAVVDPTVVGYWCQHDENESKRQQKAGDMARQSEVALAHLDQLVPTFDSWRESLTLWGAMIGAGAVEGLLKETRAGSQVSPILAEARSHLAAGAGLDLAEVDALEEVPA